MRRLISTLLLLSTLLCLMAGCTPRGDKNPERVKIRVGYMAGPTGMGMAKLIEDNGGLDGKSDRYTFTKYADTNAAKADLAAGKIDIICLPTNEAAAYREKIDPTASILAINCLNSLYYLSADDGDPITLKDLEGQTIYTCKNGTPRIILEYILREAGVNASLSYTVDGKDILTPQDLSAQLIAGNIPNAVMPEPLVTSSILKAKSDGGIILSVRIDLGDEWNAVCDTPLTMGCVVADGDFLRDNKTLVDEFLTEYKDSVEYISNPENVDSAADYVVKSGVMTAAPAAKMALTNLGNSISYMDGNDMKIALISFYSAMGISLPEDEFYYAK